jgi:hypothetical protein
MMKWALWMLATTVLACSFAHAGECVGLVDIQKATHRPLPPNLPSVACGSITTVIASVMNRSRIGGRKLEDDKPVNVAEAQQNLNSALRDSSIRRRMDQLRRDVHDEDVRAIYEAAILDEEGYYKARDLRIMQLSERLK